MSHSFQKRSALLAAAALLTALIVPMGAESAQALPPDCSIEVTWHNGTTYVKDDGTIVETGIHSTQRVVCGPTTDWTPGGDPSTGGGPTSAPPPPAPPGPELPKPPDSIPPSAAPPCVSGASNSSHPGQGDGNQTGSGKIAEDVVTAALATGDVKIDWTAPPRILSMDVNVGPSMSGEPGVNPFEGVDADSVPNAMYWSDGFDPSITPVGATLMFLEYTAKNIFRAVKSGDLAASAALRATWGRLPAADRKIVADFVMETIRSTAAAYKYGVPEEIKDIAEGALQWLELAAEIPGPITDTSDIDAVPLYIAASTQPRFSGDSSIDNDGVCGQISQASVGASTIASVSPTGTWVHVTLQGTVHGTLVDRIKALSAPEVHCPEVQVDAIANQENLLNVTSGCTGSITGARILNRAEISGLSNADRLVMMAASGDDPSASSVFRFDSGRYDHVPPRPWRESTSSAGVDTIHFSGDSKDGVLSYTTLKPHAGQDFVVVAAKDASGVEHPFLVKIIVKAPPRCDNLTKPVGPSTSSFRAVIQDGALQLVRNVPFTLDLKLFCTTDVRDTYRVILEKSIPGTEPTINSDGTVTFTWTDPDVVSDHKEVLTLTPWDETTGAPGETFEVPVVVRDVAPSCNDLEVDYDKSELKGAPLVIPMNCGMEGELKVLAPPFLTFSVPSDNVMIQVVDGGTFTSDGASVSFTPGATEADVSTAHVVPWTQNPYTYSPYRVHGKTFDIDVRMTE